MLQENYQKTINDDVDNNVEQKDNVNSNKNQIEDNDGGIDLDDPILQYNYTHTAVASKSK